MKNDQNIPHRDVDTNYPDSVAWQSNASIPTAQTPRPHQQRSLDDVLAALKKKDRATLVMACGTGKTLVGLLAAAEITRKRSGIVVALFPSLALIRQTFPVWLDNWPNWNKFRFMVVCSDKGAGKRKQIDDIEFDPSDLPFDVSTRQDQVEEFIASRKRGQTIVIFVTYHSAPVVGNALIASSQKADLCVCDEAHRTAGSQDSAFGAVLHNDLFPAKRRLFMTATPRITKRYQKRQADGEFPVISMDNEALYGPIAHRYSFGDAADAGIILRYEVIVSHVSRSELSGKMPEAEEADLIALIKAMRFTGAKKVFSYHANITEAQKFADDARGFLPRAAVVHINGNQKMVDREALMERFADAKKAVATNVRCLSEGVDVPATDMVAFMAKKDSEVDIVQAVGRALRVHADKTVGYILVPLLMDLDEGETEEDAVKRHKLKTMWRVLSSLMDEDGDLACAIRARTGGGRGVGGGDLPIKVLSEALDPKSLMKAIEVSCARTMLGGFEIGLSRLREYQRREGNCLVPRDHKERGFSLGQWVAVQRNAYKKGVLLPERIAALEAIPGWTWDVHGESFQKLLEALVAYERREGNCLVPLQHKERGLGLGHRVATQRREYKKGTLSSDRISALEAIPGWTWSQKEKP